mgnify:CR=1 FL=1
MKKRLWQEPVVKSIDQCQPIFGECKVGTSPSATPGGPIQCNSGTGATTSGACTKGNGAKLTCSRGNGVQ